MASRVVVVDQTVLSEEYQFVQLLSGIPHLIQLYLLFLEIIKR